MICMYLDIKVSALQSLPSTLYMPLSLKLADAHSTPINMCEGGCDSAALCGRDNHACRMIQCRHTPQSIAYTRQ